MSWWQETPVAFPGWRGYPPTFDDRGKVIDYTLTTNGGVLSTKKLIDTHLMERRPQHGRRAGTPHDSVHTAGNTTRMNKLKDRSYQENLRSIKPSEYSPEVHGVYKYARTMANQATQAFGFIRN